MSKSNKNELTEDRVREIIQEELDEALEYYVEEDEVKKLVNEAVRQKNQEFENSWRTKHETEEKVMREINGNIGNIVYRKLEEIVAEQVKMIEDKLLVELARQAMSLGVGNE